MFSYFNTENYFYTKCLTVSGLEEDLLIGENILYVSDSSCNLILEEPNLNEAEGENVMNECGKLQVNNVPMQNYINSK